MFKKFKIILGTLKNSGKNCWDGCNEQEGKCDWCGTEGFCCKKDSIGNGCDGVFGGQDNHECVRKYGTTVKSISNVLA